MTTAGGVVGAAGGEGEGDGLPDGSMMQVEVLLCCFKQPSPEVSILGELLYYVCTCTCTAVLVLYKFQFHYFSFVSFFTCLFSSSASF